MSGLGNVVGDFLASPFDPNQDGKTSALELAAGLGLVMVVTYLWTRVLSLVFSKGSD